MALYEKVLAANALYHDNPKKIKRAVDVVFEEEKLRLEGDKNNIDKQILELDKEKSKLMRFTKEAPVEKLDLFQKLDYAKTLYTGNYDELSDAVKGIFEEQGLEKKNYTQALQDLFNEKGTFAKHSIFGRKDVEYNARVEEMEKILGIPMHKIKTESFLKRWNLPRIAFYVLLTGLCATSRMGIYTGTIFGLAASLVVDTVVFNGGDKEQELRLEGRVMERTKKLDHFVGTYL